MDKIIKQQFTKAAMMLLMMLLTATTAWAETVETYYIDKNDTRHDVTATVLTGSETNLAAGWYVAKGTLNIDHTLNLTNGDVTLILADGCSMNVGTSGSRVSGYGINGTNGTNLTIYGQSAQTGTLSAYVNSNETQAIYTSGNFTVNGGNINVNVYTIISNLSAAICSYKDLTVNGGNITANSLIVSYNNLTITGGSVKATNDEGYSVIQGGRVIISGGNVTATAANGSIVGIRGSNNGPITLGWTRATDRIKASSYSGNVTIATGKAFLTDDATPVQVSGPVSNLSTIAGKTLTPEFSADFSKDSDTEYTIHTAKGWDYFCDFIEGGETFSGKTVKLEADITVSSIAGSGAGGNLTESDHPFCGTFDGGGNTLTFNYGSNGNPANEDYIAPFRYVNNATIQHLHVAGDIYTQHTHSAGIVGLAYGTSNITDCRSSVNIHSSINGDGTHGGIMACSWKNSTTSIEGCLFDGSIQSATGYTTDQCGGFVGWKNATINVTNSLLTADLSTIGAASGEKYPSATFVRNGEANRITNSYYVTALGTVQGKKAYAMDAAPANLSAQVTDVDYTVLTAYENGILFDGKYYVAPATVSLADNAANDMTAINGYLADVTLTDRTLYKDGAWNTLCLPFSVTAAQMAETTHPLYGATIKELDATGTYSGKQTGFDATDGTLYLYFKDATTIEAGKPYIVKWATTGSNIENPVFSGVTVSSAAPTGVTRTDDGKYIVSAENSGLNTVQFIGSYSPLALNVGDKSDKSNLFIGTSTKSGNTVSTLYYPNAANNQDGNYYINAFRGYFHVNLGNATGVRAFQLNFGEDEKTGIVELKNSRIEELKSDTGWYALDGRKLSGKPAKKGMYVYCGKKVVIK